MKMKFAIHQDIIRRYFCWETEPDIAMATGLRTDQIKKEIASFCGLNRVYPTTRTLRSATEFKETTGVDFPDFIKCLKAGQDDSSTNLVNGLRFFSINTRSAPPNVSTIREILRKSADLNLVDENSASDFLDLTFETRELRLGIYLSRHFCLEKYLLLFASALVDEEVFYEVYSESLYLSSEFKLFDDYFFTERDWRLVEFGVSLEPKIYRCDEPSHSDVYETFSLLPDGIASTTELSNSQKREVIKDPFPLAKLVQFYAKSKKGAGYLEYHGDEISLHEFEKYQYSLNYVQEGELPNEIGKFLENEILSIIPTYDLSRERKLNQLKAKIANCKEHYLKGRLRKVNHNGDFFFFYIPLAYRKAGIRTLLDRNYRTLEISSNQYKTLKFIDFPIHTLAKNYLLIQEHFGLSANATHNVIRPFVAKLESEKSSDKPTWREISEEVNLLGAQLLRDEGREYDRDSLLTMLGYSIPGDDEIPF